VREDQPDYGKRDRTSGLMRLIGCVLVAGAALGFEAGVAPGFEQARADAIQRGAENWAVAELEAPDGYVPIPPKAAGVARVVYISNSHAATGGHVARHLHRLLDAASPGRFEILDLSAPGIFAPDMLQRALRARAYEPDVVVLAPAYISFADRMRLSLQARSARGFLRERVGPDLSPGFWLRNYELGVYGEALISRLSRSYAHRNAIRDEWEKPLAALMRRGFSDARRVRFLEVDENQSWMFPDGYDRNLFQWSLYAAGRRNHLADLAEAVSALEAAGITTVGANLPIDFGKSTDPHSDADYAAFRASLRGIFARAAEYVDYQDTFPVVFSTYDALHPNWHGARLHALDLSSRLLRRAGPHGAGEASGLLKAFHALDAPTDEVFSDLAAAASQGGRPDGAMRRFDISEPDNARNLLARLAASDVASPKEQDLLIGFAVRARFWAETAFSIPEMTDGPLGNHWRAAVSVEIDRARVRAAGFARQAARLQARRLEPLRLPMESARKVGTETLRADGRVIEQETLVLKDGSRVLRYSISGRPFALRIFDESRHVEYSRVDVFGDGSFAMALDNATSLWFPPWVVDATPPRDWGV
jgi:hypothetical protein